MRIVNPWSYLGPLAVLAGVGVGCASTSESAPASYGAPARTTAIGPDVHPGDGDVEASKQRGAAIYRESCAACHQADGAGLQGAFPPLKGTDFVIGEKDAVIRTVLFGLSGPIEVKGVRYDGQMPAHAEILSDSQIADVLTYVRSAWGNKAGPVHADDVSRERLRREGQPQT